MRTNKRDAYSQPVNNEKLFADATFDFVAKNTSNNHSYQFCLNYYLKKFNKEHKETAFLYLCDQYLKPKEGDCGTEKDQFNWAREKAGKLRNIAIGSIAPVFDMTMNCANELANNDNRMTMNDPKLSLHQLQSDYTLLLFWASWCPHCT